MTPAHQSLIDAPRRGGARLAVLCLLAAAAWLVSRVFIGLDFTDEMQYYGEIGSLVRTGKLFQDDLFLQQLGYVWVYPLFKLHAALFPDQHYLILFGRLSFCVAYALAALLFWRCATANGSFTRPQKLCGLAAFLAWIPFQLFAFCYNSLAYLLIVTLLSLWLARARLRFSVYAAGVALVLMVLLPSYPPAGLALTGVMAAEAALRLGRRRGLVILGLTFVAGGLAALGIIILHGSDFPAALRESVEFSRGFSLGQLFGSARQLTIASVIIGSSGLLVYRLYRRAPVSSGGTQGDGRRVRLPHLIAAGAALILAGLSVDWSAGYFAPLFFVVLLVLLVGSQQRSDDTTAADLGLFGLLLGTVFSISGGDGIRNFATGAAPVFPFLIMLVAGRQCRGDVLPVWVQAAAAPLLVMLLLLNGAVHPYREQRGWSGFQRVRGVPAFAGIWTSPDKIDALERFRELSENGALRGKRVLVAGPHAWLYFTSGGQPATPMFFMHYTADQEAHYTWIADRLFRTGEPDAIFLTNSVPPPIGKKIQEWAQAGPRERSLQLPIGFIRRYRRQTDYDFAGQIYLLTRPSTPPP
ncbi:MAG TPA: hypothetical protein VM029_21015 [Opitutaceae bacterium]|nr:hypothetical protein [Opitutaceae bacterium]